MDPASILNFVNKRARADFVGYVDVVTLAPVATPVIRGIRVFNTLVNVPGTCVLHSGIFKVHQPVTICTSCVVSAIPIILRLKESSLCTLPC